MSNEKEQAITKQNLRFLIAESDRHHKREGAYRIAQIVVTPLIITLVSTIITWSINKQQARNTAQITEKQIESAEIIAKANRDNSTRISESDQRIERLKQIKQVLGYILELGDKNAELTEEDFETLRVHIISLEVYKEEALIFLLNIKEHFRNKLKNNLKAEHGPEHEILFARLLDQADTSVSRILQNSQIDLSGRKFKESIESTGAMPSFATEYSEAIRGVVQDAADDNGKILKGLYIEKDSRIKLVSLYQKLNFNKINMRNQRYHNFNFSNSEFLSVNLYRGDFSYCTLLNSLFVDVDFQEASFSESNLSGSIFWDSNLKKTNFRDAKLRNVIFINPIMNKRDADKAVKDFCDENTCCELEGAQFSLGSLLHTRHPPFNIFDSDNRSRIPGQLRRATQDLYINLLVPHRESLEFMVMVGKNKDDRANDELKKLFANTGTVDWKELNRRLLEAGEKAKMLAAPNSGRKLSLLSFVRP